MGARRITVWLHLIQDSQCASMSKGAKFARSNRKLVAGSSAFCQRRGNVLGGPGICLQGPAAHQGIGTSVTVEMCMWAGGKGVFGAIECVAGDMTATVVRTVREGGTTYLYGGLSGLTASVDVVEFIYGACPVPPRLLVPEMEYVMSCLLTSFELGFLDGSQTQLDQWL